MHLRRPKAIKVICMRSAYVSVAGCFIFAAALMPAPAAARTVYDGNWSVLIVTNSGPCDRAYRYGLAIRDGSVMYDGSAPVNVAGKVQKNGVVNVRVWAGRQGANGIGRLSRTAGGGEWRGTGSMGSCAGSWSAERRR
jgi:hypothetical protein